MWVIRGRRGLFTIFFTLDDVSLYQCFFIFLFLFLSGILSLQGVKGRKGGGTLLFLFRPPVFGPKRKGKNLLFFFQYGIPTLILFFFFRRTMMFIHHSLFFFFFLFQMSLYWSIRGNLAVFFNILV